MTSPRLPALANLHGLFRQYPRVVQAPALPALHDCARRLTRQPHRRKTMARLLPDPTFYPSATLASEAPPEKLAYVALLAEEGNGYTDGLGVIDTDPASPEYGTLIGKVDFPHAGN